MATAYASLLSVLKDLEAIKNNPYHFFSFESKQIQSLSESVDFLINFMESNDNYHGASKEAARVLERTIARAARAAEDVIESHVVDQINGGSTKHGKRTPRFLMDLQKVIEGMEFVKRKAMKVVKMRSGLKPEMQPTYIPAATSSSSTSESYTMVGFDDVLLQLLDQLTGEASNLQIIPITGMGGIGKTTLAKNAFKHPLIVQRFDVRCWATISQEYVVGDVLSKLLYDHGNSNVETVHELGEQLYKRLYGRRYLIVLDDVWSTNIWDEIKNFFPNTSKGMNRIVVTSRLTEVAVHLSSPCFPMRLLDESTSWELFCQKAFAGHSCPPVLEDAGKRIVAKCGGLPLLLVVVGGHLGKSPRTQENWENVAKHMMVTVYDSGENELLQVFDILSLSYNYLPVYLKPCFLYMGTIPEYKEFYMDDIIKLWIAEGFVKQNQAGESLETIAEGYLKDLVERNLVLVDELFMMVFGGKIRRCRIHDVIRVLCLKIAKKEQFLDLLDAPRAIDREERRVVISAKIGGEHESEIFDAQRSAPLIRSLTWLDGKIPRDLKLVRVVKAGKGEINPSANLRYLECSFEYILLPFSIFWNLQTLILRISGVICPYEIWDMVHLRHLVCHVMHLPDPLYRDRSHQVNLLTLDRVYNFRMIEEVCEKTPRLKELCLSYGELGENLERATSYLCPQNLSRFRELESLNCDFGDNTICNGFALSFTFPSSLKHLILAASRLEWEELTVMVGSLPLLQLLCLVNDAVIGSEWTTVEGTFMSLTTLIIDSHDLVNFNADSSHFPRLRTLYLSGFAKMNALSSEIGELPSLELLVLKQCNLSLMISALGILDEQEEQGNESLKLEVIFVDDDNENRFMDEVGEDGLTRKNLSMRRGQHRKSRECVKNIACMQQLRRAGDWRVISNSMEDIIKLWIAEGFVKQNQAGESLETIAEGYLKDLVERNLVLVDEMFMMFLGGKITQCRIHDVIRVSCLKIAKKEQFLDLLDAPRAIDREECRVVISAKIGGEHEFEIFDAQRSAPLIRSLTWLAGKLSHDLKLVRAVNVGNREIELNRGMFRSANLRYLECSSEYIPDF